MNINNVDFLEKRDLREKVISKTEVLDKVGNLLLLKGNNYATTKQVANYYKVGLEAIQSIVKRFINELESDGFKTLTGKETKEFLVNEGIAIKNYRGYFLADGEKFANRNNILFSRLAILKFAFLLSESEIASNIRRELLNNNKSLYLQMSKENSIRFKKYEEEIKNYLEFTFGKGNVKYQVACGNYKLDFVLFKNIHIEVDENGHYSYNKIKEKIREDYILDNTDYWTIRYNPHKQKPYELIRDILELFTHIGYPKELIN